jgi:L-threonylcarbamoyladenylate synthase
MSTTYPTGSEDEREAAIEAAAQAVQRGGLVVLPTDTVYGVGADAFDHAAVQALLDAKGRGREMPPPVLISAATTLSALASNVQHYVEALTEAFWPGPLTLVCDQQPSLTWDLGETRGTVAVRMPDHEVALALLERTGPLAVSSANLSGLPAATEAPEAEGMLGDSVEVVLDDGPSPRGKASTILDVRLSQPRLLRRGALAVTQLNEVLQPLGCTVVEDDDEEPVTLVESPKPAKKPVKKTAKKVAAKKTTAKKTAAKTAKTAKTAMTSKTADSERAGEATE